MALDPEEKAKFKAAIIVEMESTKPVALTDSGCGRSCLDEAFIRRSPKYKNHEFVPLKNKTVSIDGSAVNTIGIVKVPFRINGRHFRMNFRVVRNLVYDVVLGWDFLQRYRAKIDAFRGLLEFEAFDPVPLIPNSLEMTHSHFCLIDDVTVPPYSKMLLGVDLKIDPATGVKIKDTVISRPLPGQNARVCVTHGIHKPKDGRFTTEVLNPFPVAMSLEAGTILGHVDFGEEEHLAATMEETGISYSYEDEDSGYESNADPVEEDCDVGAAAPDRKDSDSLHPPGKEKPPKATPNPKPHKPPDSSPAPDNAGPPIKLDNITEDAKPYKTHLQKLLSETCGKAFQRDEHDQGRTNVIHHHAGIKPGPPIACRLYRTTPEHTKIIEKEVHQMLANNLVSHSNSPYSAPVLLIPKKNGGWRLVTDFRKVNARCERQVYPLPRIEDSLQRLKDPKFFSCLDLAKGFWQVPIVKEDRKYFAFSAGSMHVEYNVMPMGALNSSSTLQALMTLILRGLPPENIICFLDDILIASSTMEEHLQHLEMVLNSIIRAGLKLNPDKCIFAQDSIVSLGHKVSRDGIGPDPHNLDKIRKWKAPTSRTEVKQFLGLTGYYRQMIQGYAKIANCLTHLTKNDTVWTWGQEEQKAFETLRDYLTSDSIMAYPDFEKDFWVKTDASGTCVGHVLTQFPLGKEKIISYGSKKLTDTQLKWITYDKEFFALIIGVKDNCHYLRHRAFKAITDHRPLLAFRKIDPKDDPTGRRIRWANYLELYDFELIYRPGKKHSDADALSRMDHHSDYAKDDEELGACALNDEDKAKELQENEWVDVNEETVEYAFLGMEDRDEQTAVELIASDNLRDTLRLAQDMDLTIAEVKAYVRKRKNPPDNFPATFYKRNFNRLTIRGGILLRKAFCKAADTAILQAIIPPALVKRVMNDSHGHPLAGHPGYRKMVQSLERHVVWPTIVKDCNEFVTKCAQCDRAKKQVPKPKTPLVPITANYTLEHMACDMLTLPYTKGGYRYILMFEDIFTRYIWLYKTKDKKAETVAYALENLVSHVGVPTRLTSDNGREFENCLLDAVTKLLGVKRATSVVYRPQSQGMVERNNKQVCEELRKRLEQFGLEWTNHYQFLMLAHNCTPHAKNGVSPYLAFYGRDPPLPNFTDISKGTLLNKTAEAYVEEFQRRLAHIHDAVRKNAAAKSAKEKEAYDRKVKHTPFVPGDKVYTINHTASKLEPRYSGPVEVTSRRTDAKGAPGTTYICKYKDGSTLTRNYEQLKRVHADVDLANPGYEPPAVVTYPRWYSSGSESDEKSSNEPPQRPQRAKRTVRIAEEPVACRTRQRTKAASTPAAQLPPGTACSSILKSPPSTACIPAPDTSAVVIPPPTTIDLVITPLPLPPPQSPPLPPLPALPSSGLAAVENGGYNDAATQNTLRDEGTNNQGLVGFCNFLDASCPSPEGVPNEGVANKDVFLARLKDADVAASTSGAIPAVTTPSLVDQPQVLVDPAPTPPTPTVEQSVTSANVIQAEPSSLNAPQAEFDHLGAAGPAEPVTDQAGHPTTVTPKPAVKFHYNIGRSFITVLEHQDHHYRLDRKDEISKIRQRWPCRWAPSPKCKARVILIMLEVGALENFQKMEVQGQHNHEPRDLTQDRPARSSTNELSAVDPFIQQHDASSLTPLNQIAAAATDLPTVQHNAHVETSVGEASTPTAHLAHNSWDDSNISFDFRQHVASSGSHSSPLVVESLREVNHLPAPLAPILEEAPAAYEPSRNHSFWDATQ